MVAGVSYSSARRPRSSSTSTSSSIGGSVDLMTGEVSAIIRATQPLVSLGRENRTRFDIHSTMAQSAKEMDLKRFDGAGRRCIDWDGLRRVRVQSIAILNQVSDDNHRIQNYGFQKAIAWYTFPLEASLSEAQHLRFRTTRSSRNAVNISFASSRQRQFPHVRA